MVDGRKVGGRKVGVVTSVGRKVGGRYRCMVQWYSGTVVQWHTGTVVHWYSGTVAQCYSGTVVGRIVDVLSDRCI